jgi:DNA-binding NarL/FixJ family response regulator
MLIERESHMEVVAEADNGRTAVELTKQFSPDIVIMDITMPGMNGIEATRAISTEVPGTKVIALSMHSDRRFVSAMIEAGASDYLTKDCTFGELASTILAVENGHSRRHNKR